jgi:hypothetical protein
MLHFQIAQQYNSQADAMEAQSLLKVGRNDSLLLSPLDEIFLLSPASRGNL